MNDKNLILCLFYSDEEKRVFDKIKFFESLSNESKLEIRTLSLRFLEPSPLLEVKVLETLMREF